ncbi:metalloendopeptidase OMA1, mitochondrial isoform X2 [Mobula birostris]|uniref:metalloendopeptidase OMA1, mitochondrial isoform X2 n=1 Tax=Mobula birostris TaxID=1983395 RepID=UPI003B28C424
MKTGFWLQVARRHLLNWQNYNYQQSISPLPEMKHQRLTSSLCCLGRDSEVWQTWIKPNVVLLPCTRHHSVFRNFVHNVGLPSKRPPAIIPSQPSFRDFSHCTRWRPAYIFSTKLFIAKETTDLHNDFHTTSRVLALPIPLFWILLKPLKKVAAMFLGRSIRKWWNELPNEQQELLKDRVKKNKWRILFGLCGISGVIGLYFLTHLDKSPITGRRRLLVFSKRQYLKLAEFEYQSVLEKYKDKFLPNDDPIYKAIQFVFNQLIERNKDIPGVSETKWIINVVEDPEINAFVLPAEHASIIQLLDFMSLVFLTLTWAVFPRDSLALLGQWIQGKLIQYMFDRPYSRKLEIEADEIGLQLAAKACIDVRASSVYWRQLELMKIVSGTFQIPEWFSTHPSNERRVQHLDNLIPKAIKLRDECGCTSLPSIDPRLVFKLSMEEMMKRLKKWEEPMCTVSGTEQPTGTVSGAEQPPQQQEIGPIVMQRIPAVITLQALQSTADSQK